MTTTARGLQKRDDGDRPPGYLGPLLMLVGGACFAAGMASWIGPLLSLGAGVLGLGLNESVKAFDAWRAATALRGHDVIVRRRFMRQATLELPSIDGVATRFHRAFAVSDARAWMVRAPARCPVDAVIERRGLLTIGGVPVHDPAFDKAFVVRAHDVDGAHLAALLPAAARGAIARLFAHAIVHRVRLRMDGELEVQLHRSGASPRPVVEVLPGVRALIDALGERTRQLPSVASLRGHSPTGNPVGLG